MPYRPRRACLIATLLLAAASQRAKAADWLDFSQHTWSFVGEAGASFTPVLNISGANQSNATATWGGVAPDLRAEAWLTRPGAWNLGFTAQPIFQTFKGTLTAPVSIKAENFAAGAPASLNFAFPFIRATANYPVWSNDTAELRLGLSLIARYASNTLKSGGRQVQINNVIALPQLNMEARVAFGGPWSGVFRADILPGENTTGLYEAFAGVRYAFADNRHAVELGSRTFFGGYEPNTTDMLNNRVLFQSVVVRFEF